MDRRIKKHAKEVQAEAHRREFHRAERAAEAVKVAKAA